MLQMLKQGFGSLDVTGGRRVPRSGMGKGQEAKDKPDESQGARIYFMYELLAKKVYFRIGQ